MGTKQPLPRLTSQEASGLTPLAAKSSIRRETARLRLPDRSFPWARDFRRSRAQARLPQACCSARTAVRRRRGSAREVALSLHVIQPGSPSEVVLQGQRHWRRRPG